jgi:hypothetical protein
MYIWVVMRPHQIREIDQNAALGAPLIACLYAKEPFWYCRFPVFKAELLIRPERQERPCEHSLAMRAPEKHWTVSHRKHSTHLSTT